MSLKNEPLETVPETTAEVARASFPKGHPYLTLRDEMGDLFKDNDFADLFPTRGQPALAPWRLAWVTILQFRETLSDRQAADAVRARIDWKYLLGLELTDSGFDFSVLSEFRARLIAGEAEERLLSLLLTHCRDHGLLKARGRQRTDATHILANVRELNRLELVGETLRAALNELAAVEPDWLRPIIPPEWFKRYGRRIEDNRLPTTAAKRQEYAQLIGEDGFFLLDHIDALTTPRELQQLPQVQALRIAWRRHYTRTNEPPQGGSSGVSLKTHQELKQAAEKIESPYDTEARYRSKSGMNWTGYMVHLSETCDDNTVHLITHVHTTAADVHEAKCTELIHQALVKKDLAPKEHLVDAGYIDAELLVSSQQDHGIDIVGPPRENPSWQGQIEGGYDVQKFVIHWQQQYVTCPQGKRSSLWREQVASGGQRGITARFRARDCKLCPSRSLCTRAKFQGRKIYFPPQAQYEALKAIRERLASDDGRLLYHRRAGIEGTLSQGIRAFGIRKTRYRGLAKTHLQQVAAAVAINLDRIAAWLVSRPLAKTRTSQFAALAA